ncbi:MAG: hypothetical protein U0794_03855 [Isosphaeraceae bacterium]
MTDAASNPGDNTTRPPDHAPRRSNAVGPALVLSLTLAFHVWQTLSLFPTWSAIHDDQPVVMVDHAIHLYHGALGAGFLRGAGRTWGYDPYFMAGYPETPVWDSSSNLAIATQWLGGGSGPRGAAAAAYKGGLVVYALLAWLAIPLGARAAGLTWGEAAAGGVLAVAWVWAGMPAMFWRTGLFAFVTASGGLPLVLGLALALARHRSAWRWLALAGTGTGWLFAHVTTPLLLAGGLLGFGLTHLQRPSRRVLGAALLAGLVGVVLNLFWLVPLWRFRSIRTATFFFLASDDPWYLAAFYRDNLLDGRISFGLLALGSAGFVAWWFEPPGNQRRARTATIAGSAVLLLALTAFGGVWITTRALEPFRFLVPLNLLLTVPAGSFLVRLVRGLAQRGGRAVAVLACGMGAVVVGLASSDTFILATRVIREQRALALGLRPDDRALVAWLRDETDGSARVLFEDQLRLLESTDIESTHWTPLLPMLLASTPRLFIGGIYHTAFIAHNRAASFGDYTLADRTIDTWSADELAAYCNRYNIGWVVCWSPLSRYAMDHFPLAKRVGTQSRPASRGLEIMRDEVQYRRLFAQAGPTVAARYMQEGVNQWALYRIERPHSYFLEGQGRLSAFTYDRIELADLVPDPATGYVTVSLHWLDSWQASPPVPILPLTIPGDPVPVVRIRLAAPVAKLVLSNGPADR